jgi:hypothetical protein
MARISDGRPDDIQDYLVTVRTGQWFGFSDDDNQVYANLIVLDGGSKPSESDCTNGLTDLQTAWDDAVSKKEADKTSGNNKLKALGLTDDEIEAVTQ